MGAKNKTEDARRFSEVVAERGPLAVGRKATNFRTELHRASGVAVSYERFRQQIEGEETPQAYVMEAIGRVFGISPESFLEYRLCRIGAAFERHPEMANDYYTAVMADAAALDADKGLTSAAKPEADDSGSQ